MPEADLALSVCAVAEPVAGPVGSSVSNQIGKTNEVFPRLPKGARGDPAEYPAHWSETLPGSHVAREVIHDVSEPIHGLSI